MLYEAAKVNVNHPKGHPSAPRDYQDRIGVIRSVEVRAGEGLFGDLHYNPKHVLAEQLAWDAEHAPENVGFSHNVRARTTRRGDAVIVEEILAVNSVDLVADPATTSGLFEGRVRADRRSPSSSRPKELVGLRSRRPRPTLRRTSPRRSRSSAKKSPRSARSSRNTAAAHRSKRLARSHGRSEYVGPSRSKAIRAKSLNRTEMRIPKSECKTNPNHE